MTAPLVLINNVYSYRNRGDSAIVEALAGYLRHLAPQARICLLSQYWIENQAYYQRGGFASAPPLWDIPMDDHKLRRLARAGSRLGPLLWPGQRGAHPTLPLYRQASVIVDAGGGSLFSSNRYAFYLGLYQHLFNLWMGVRLGKPVILAPQSIGPFNKKLDELAVRALLRRVRGVMVREPISARLLASWEVPCHQVPDAAFLNRFLPGDNPHLPGLLARLRSAPPGQVTVGVTVLDWAWAHQEGRAAAPLVEEYLDKLATALATVGRSTALRVLVVPQVTAGFGDSDRRVSRALCDRLGGRVAAIELIDEDLVAADLKAVYGCCQVLIGSRMHSTILAMLAGVPTLGLAYQPKTTGVFEQLGLADYVLDIAGFAPEDLSARLERMLGERDRLRDRVRAGVAAARAQVETAFRDAVGPFLTAPDLPRDRP